MRVYVGLHNKSALAVESVDGAFLGSAEWGVNNQQVGEYFAGKYSVPRTGFEPAAFRSGGERSIH